MSRDMTEDAVRDLARDILGLADSDVALSGVGQLTTFNRLGFPGVADKPDGWYLPKNKADVALVLETKASRITLGKAQADEVLKNVRIMQTRYEKVVGVLYNGEDVRVFKGEEEVKTPGELQRVGYYLSLFTVDSIDKERIYQLTARINNCLHFEFGIKNLYHRMVFTACALVAERYGAGLKRLKDLGYATFHTGIHSTLSKSLDDSRKQNAKIDILLEEYSDIKMNSTDNQGAIDDFIDWVVEISECVNSNEWRGEDVMGIFFNEFNRYKKKSESGQVFTPEHITDFIYKILEVGVDDCILDATCGSGGFLVKAMANMIRAAGGMETKKAGEIKSKQLYGIEFDREIYALACANMLIHKDGKTNLEQMDARTDKACEWIKSKPVTKVLMNPPYENKYGCMTIVENVLDSVPAHTQCAFILPDKKLEKASKAQIGNILKKHRLRKVVKLPESLFFGVGVTTSVFVFESGVAQDGKEFFACYMESDGLATVKNKGRHDVYGKWADIEAHWVDVVLKQSGDDTCQWVDPAEHLSYQVPQKPFEIYEEDFRKAAMDYLMFQKGVDAKEFGERLLDTALYSSRVSADADSVTLTIRKQADGEENAIDVAGWRKFKITDVFRASNTKGVVQKDVLPDSGTVPYVTAQAGNNGVASYVDCPAEWLEEGNCIMVGGKTLAFSYQSQAFCSNDSHNIALHIKEADKASEARYLFLIAALRMSLCQKYSWGDSISMKTVKDDTFYLPVDASGGPDWAYMDECMQAIVNDTRFGLSAMQAIV